MHSYGVEGAEKWFNRKQVYEYEFSDATSVYV